MTHTKINICQYKYKVSGGNDRLKDILNRQLRTRLQGRKNGRTDGRQKRGIQKKGEKKTTA